MVLSVSELIICGGFPKCGTTTVAGIFDLLPGYTVHPSKEPGGLQKESFLASSYQRSFNSSNYLETLVDFTTTYGLEENRNRVIENLRISGLISSCRAIVCVRDPFQQSFSNFKHKVGHLQFLGEMPKVLSQDECSKVVSQLPMEQDYRGSIDCFADALGPENLFVIRMEDLAGAQRQVETVSKLTKWLRCDSTPLLDTHVILNDSRQIYYYGSWLQKLRDIAVAFGAARFLSIKARANIRRMLGRKSNADFDADYIKSLIERNISKEQTLFYDSLVTGPWSQ